MFVCFYFLAFAFFAVAFFAGFAAFLAGDFLAAFGLAAAFFGDFAGFLAAVFLAAFLGDFAFLAAGFLALGFFAFLGFSTFTSLNEPVTPVPFAFLSTPALSPFFNATLVLELTALASAPPRLLLAMMYLTMACLEEPFLSFNAVIAAAIMEA